MQRRHLLLLTVGAGTVVSLSGVGLWLGTGRGTPSLAAADPLTGLPNNLYEPLRNSVPPRPGEDAFDAIPWQTSLHAARIEAAKTGKPILLWEMDGHPLGCG
ncbi:MAG: hypothetical protein ACRCZF_26220 [Gemmataceae bacterium]